MPRKGYREPTVKMRVHQEVQNRLAAAMSLVRKLEWRYNKAGMREGEMCPVCYQFKPLTAYPASWREFVKWFGHKPDCWLGKAIARLFDGGT